MADISKTAEMLVKQYAEVPYTFSQKENAITWLQKTFRILFPQLPKDKQPDSATLQHTLEGHAEILAEVLGELSVPDINGIIGRFFNTLPNLHEMLLKDLEAIFQGDPAAKSREEIVLTYPGFTAILIYRVANFFFKEGVSLLPRVFSEYAHQITGIDIHPGATIGGSFCIDHGTGIVVGETTHIGERVKLYQGVTLGALSVKKELGNTKRHPTVEDDVVIYSNTTILGGETVIGKGSVIGGNVWLTESVPSFSKVYRKFELEVKTK